MKILCVGDSITEGYGINHSQRWSNLLSKSLSIEVVNCGISGDTTGGMLARFYSLLLQHQPSHVIILGGTNDLWFDLPDAQIMSNITAMSRQAKYLNIIPIIGIITPFYAEKATEKGAFISNEHYKVRIERFQESLKGFLKDDTQLIIDFSENMPSQLFMEDGLHPNEKGHKVLQEYATLVLKKLL